MEIQTGRSLLQIYANAVNESQDPTQETSLATWEFQAAFERDPADAHLAID